MPIRPSAGRPASPSVEVDLDTGEVHVRDVVAADDIGRVIHPVLAEGQVEGGTLQAVGYATIEEIKLRDGRYLNDRLATYIIPTALDAPRITTILVEAPFDGVPHGAKGVGELPMDVGAPAVVAAIADATGVWITDLPASPERILAGARRSAGGGGAAVRAIRAARRELGLVTAYQFTVNGTPVEVDVPGMRRLLDVLREDLALTGTKEGCGEGSAAPARSCSMARRSTRASSRSARSTVPTVADRRGPRPGGAAGSPPGLDALQTAFLVTGGAQCGICTPGMLMAGRAYLDAGGGPDDGRDPRGDRRQPVPLHRLHQDRRGHRPGRRAEGGTRMTPRQDRIAVPTNGHRPATAASRRRTDSAVESGRPATPLGVDRAVTSHRTSSRSASGSSRR